MGDESANHCTACAPEALNLNPPGPGHQAEDRRHGKCGAARRGGFQRLQRGVASCWSLLFRLYWQQQQHKQQQEQQGGIRKQEQEQEGGIRKQEQEQK